MSSLDELRNQIKSALEQGTNVYTGIKVVKAVPATDVIKILKSGGLQGTSADEPQTVEELQGMTQAQINAVHPAFKNVIYASVLRSGAARDSNTPLDRFGNLTIVMKDSVLTRPNTTYTYYDTGDYLKAGMSNQIEFYKGELLTKSELIKAEQNSGFFNSEYMEVQIRSRVSLAEIEEIVFKTREPTTEERQLANRLGVPLVYKGIIFAGDIPAERAITPTQPIRPPAAVLPIPSVTSPLITPPQLPRFPDLPKTLPPINPPPALDPSDPMPPNRVPNFTEFKSFDAAEEWLKNGKDLEVNFPPTSFPPALENAANAGNSGIWHKGRRYTQF